MKQHSRRLMFGVFIVVFFFTWLLWIAVAGPWIMSIQSRMLRYIASESGRLVVWFGMLPIYGHFLRIPDILTYVGFGKPVEWRRLPWMALDFGQFVFLYALLTLAYVTIISGKNPWFTFQDIYLASFLGVLVGPFVEEVFFRGFVLKELQEWMSFSQANLLTSVLFVTAHLPGWTYLQNWGPAFPVHFMMLCLFSYLLGDFVRRSGSIWPAIIAHSLYNFLFGAWFVLTVKVG